MTQEVTILERPQLRWRIMDFCVAIAGRLVLTKRVRITLQLIPAVLVTGLLAAGIIVMIVRSFRSFDTFTQSLGAFSFEHYERLFVSSSGLYSEVLFRTIFVSFIAAAVATLVSLPVAYFVTRSQNMVVRNVVIFALLLPFLVGETVRAFSWLYLLGSNGALEWTAGFFGIENLSILGSTLAVALGLLQIQIPLASIILITTFQRISPNLEYAASTLGANQFSVWARVLLPLAGKGVSGALIVAFAIGTTEYAIPQVLGLGAKPFVANSIHTMIFAQGNMSLGSSYALVLVVSVAASALLSAVIIALISRKSRAVNKS